MLSHVAHHLAQKTLDASLVIWLFNRNNSCGHLHVPYTKNRQFWTNWFRVFFSHCPVFFTHQSKAMQVAVRDPPWLSLDRRPVEKRLPKRCLFKRDGETTDAFWILMASNLHEWNTSCGLSEAKQHLCQVITWLQWTVGLEILQWIDGCKS